METHVVRGDDEECLEAYEAERARLRKERDRLDDWIGRAGKAYRYAITRLGRAVLVLAKDRMIADSELGAEQPPAEYLESWAIALGVLEVAAQIAVGVDRPVGLATLHGLSEELAWIRSIRSTQQAAMDALADQIHRDRGGTKGEAREAAHRAAGATPIYKPAAWAADLAAALLYDTRESAIEMSVAEIVVGLDACFHHFAAFGKVHDNLDEVLAQLNVDEPELVERPRRRAA